jgi:hypothetical protein
MSGVRDGAFEVVAVVGSSSVADVVVVVGLAVDVLIASNAWIPNAWACFECVKNANGAAFNSPPSFPAPFFGDVEDLGSRFCASVGGCSSERSFAMRASLRVFSARSAALSFWVS